jgi:hypothetical protein
MKLTLKDNPVDIYGTWFSSINVTESVHAAGAFLSSVTVLADGLVRIG